MDAASALTLTANTANPETARMLMRRSLPYLFIGTASF
jgi:hypothetical protein